MSIPLPIVALYGGSFDPVHNAHLFVIQSVLDILKPEQMRVLPCRLPPHKQTLQATEQDRLHMLRAALEDFPNVVIDQRELKREKLSYTYDSMLEIRKQEGNDCCLCFVIGWDSWISFSTWYRWQDILKLCNLLVVRRAGIDIDEQGEHNKLLAYCAQNSVAAAAVRHHACGKIVMLDTEELDLASSAIRKRVVAGQSIDDDVPSRVAAYIKNKQLYISRPIDL